MEDDFCKDCGNEIGVSCIEGYCYECYCDVAPDEELEILHEMLEVEEKRLRENS